MLRTVIIGGGPAGMIAAGTAALYQGEVILIEKNRQPGKKLLITGKGRCNITNQVDNIHDFLNNIPVNGNFLYSSFSNFSNHDTVDFFENLGLKTKLERGGRIFPATDSSKDVLLALVRYIKDVKIIHKTVIDITKNLEIIFEDKTVLKADNIILATGGVSYKSTGSTGDGFRFAEKLGHTVIPLKPALVPLETVENYDLQGLSLKNISIRLTQKGKLMYDGFGELLFTHFGLSGPLILSASCHITDFDDTKIIIDLKPALDNEVLNKRILKDFKKYSRKNFDNALDDLLPRKLIGIIVALSGINPHASVNQITKTQRLALVNILKNLTFNIKNFRPIDEAIITSGGIKTVEINPSTMESKIIKNLYFAGEIIDVNAYTGGFNLQIAFSTGYLAGQSAGRNV